MTGILPDAAALLAELVAFDTTSRESNLPMLAWVESLLAAHGVVAERITDSSGSKANLLARIGPDESGGLLLCGHSDTVPVDGQPWSGDPFTLRRSGDRLRGRGTVDMKGFIACVLATVPELVRRPLARPIWIALTHDEEVGCLGVPSLLARLAAEPRRPTMAVVGEPTGMRIVRAHKGVRAFRTRVTGRDAHSSRPDDGANAIVGGARLVGLLAELAEERRRQGPRSTEHDPPHTTVNVGLIEGGTALNVVAGSCTLTWEFRHGPEEDADALEARVTAAVEREIVPHLRAAAPQAACATEALARVDPLDMRGNGVLAALLTGLTGAPEGPPVAYGSDGSALARAGIETVLCGPGEIGQMHQPDEAITVGELEDCTAFLRRIADWAAARVS